MILDLQAESGEAAIRALHERLATTTNAILNAPRFLEEVHARMRLAPVCIAEDIALPHARTDCVSRLVLAVGRSAKPIPFDEEHRGVHLVFLIGTPKNAVTEYLRAVAALSRRLRNPGIRKQLLEASDETEFRALLSGGVTALR